MVIYENWSWVSFYVKCLFNENGYRLTYHSIAKVAPVLSEKSQWGLVAAVVRYTFYAYSHTCLWHTLDLEESHTHCTVIIFLNLQVTCFYMCMIKFHHPQTCNNWKCLILVQLIINSTWAYFSASPIHVLPLQCMLKHF